MLLWGAGVNKRISLFLVAALFTIRRSQLDFGSRVLQRCNEFFKVTSTCNVICISLYIKCFFDVTSSWRARQVAIHVSQSNTLLTTCLAIWAYVVTKLWDIVHLYDLGIIVKGTNLYCLEWCFNPGGAGVLPYLGYMGTCRWTGYGFWPRCPKQGIQFDLPLS